MKKKTFLELAQSQTHWLLEAARNIQKYLTK